MHRASRKLLRRIVQEFQTRFHGLPSELDQFQYEMLALGDFSEAGMTQSKHEPKLSDLILDLSRHGYVIAESSVVQLTEKGLEEGSKSDAMLLWEGMNKHPAIMAVIGFVGLIIAALSFIFCR